jgi:outer membrane lipoprotein-sorting protein
MIALALAVLLSAPAAQAAEAKVVSPEALRERYAGMSRLSADVVQVKEGKYWARPFESRVSMRYTPGRVEWETVAPVHALAVIEGKALWLVGPDGRRRDLGPAAGDPRLAALLGFVRALLAVDLPGIERDFVLTYGPGSLDATPKPGSQLGLFRSVKLKFAPDLEILSVDLETADEKTHLRFEHIERVLGAAGATP